MLFNSLGFAIFLPIVFLLYWCLPHKYRWILLLGASYFFYMCWNVEYGLLILFTTLVSYAVALMLEKQTSEKRKRFTVAAGVFVCLAVLFVFKYLDFIFDSICGIMQIFGLTLQGPTVTLLLPVGISFYTFQTLSYIIDVYRGNTKAEKHLGIYMLFVSYFPQLVAGPIERSKDLLPQLKAQQKFSYETAAYGLKLMAWGFFKKLVIADYLATYVDKVYSNLTGYKGLALVFAMLFFAVQIYCDFSGYSDIAIGTSKLLGINLSTNFKSPYFAFGIKEFWSRWHLTLSNWFRDYVYIPLGGNRCSRARQLLNLMITFGLSGLWHGAAWTFVIWGSIHGILQCIGRIFKWNKKEDKKQISGFAKAAGVVATFGLVCVAWVFFRAESMADAMYVLKNIFYQCIYVRTYLKSGVRTMDIGVYDGIRILAPILVLGIFDYLNQKMDVIERIGKLRPVIRWIIYVSMILIVVTTGLNGTSQFIYFQF